jgi:hypothetical protein
MPAESLSEIEKLFFPVREIRQDDFRAVLRTTFVDPQGSRTATARSPGWTVLTFAFGRYAIGHWFRSVAVPAKHPEA